MTRRHRHVGAYALVRHAGQTLLILKARGPYTGCWDLPGGGLEHGESPLEAVRRELAEETGLQALSLELLTALSHRVTHATSSVEVEDLHHLGIVYRVGVDPSGALLAAGDGQDSRGARWFEDATLADLPLTPFARRALQL